MPYFKNTAGQYIKFNGMYMKDDTCCCDPITVPLCVDVDFDPADYDLWLQFYNLPSYSDDCATCDLLISSPFVLEWNVTNTFWFFRDTLFGDECADFREIAIGVENGCAVISGEQRLGLRGVGWNPQVTVNTFDSSLGWWLYWGFCTTIGKWVSYTFSGFPTPSTNIPMYFPTDSVVTGTWYTLSSSLGEEVMDDLGGDTAFACDCFTNPSTGPDNGPSVRAMLVPA